MLVSCKAFSYTHASARKIPSVTLTDTICQSKDSSMLTDSEQYTECVILAIYLFGTQHNTKISLRQMNELRILCVIKR